MDPMYHQGPMRGKQEGQRKGDVTVEGEMEGESLIARLEDAALLTLKTEAGAMSQGIEEASRSRKRQANRFFSLELPEGMQPC